MNTGLSCVKMETDEPTFPKNSFVSKKYRQLTRFWIFASTLSLPLPPYIAAIREPKKMVLLSFRGKIILLRIEFLKDLPNKKLNCVIKDTEALFTSFEL